MTGLNWAPFHQFYVTTNWCAVFSLTGAHGVFSHPINVFHRTCAL